MSGRHLVVDIKCDLKDVGQEFIYNILDELPDRIKMDKLTPPIVVKGLPEDPGWTGVVIICTSHIAIHTFDKTNLINLDIFSCRDFDHDKVLKYLKEKFNPSEMKHDTWNR